MENHLVEGDRWHKGECEGVRNRPALALWWVSDVCGTIYVRLLRCVGYGAKQQFVIHFLIYIELFHEETKRLTRKQMKNK